AVDGFDPAAFAFASSTSFLIFAQRRTTRFRLIWCRDLSPFNLDIFLSYSANLDLPARRHNLNVPIDPVCGMTVNPATPLRMDYGGTTYYFCAPSCVEKFRAAPERYLAP